MPFLSLQSHLLTLCWVSSFCPTPKYWGCYKDPYKQSRRCTFKDPNEPWLQSLQNPGPAISQAAGSPDEGGAGQGVMNGNAEPELEVPSSWETAGGKAKGDQEEERE